MVDYCKWVDTLAMTESLGNEYAHGDSGLAFGRWQMHPAFVWDYGPDEVNVRESWDSVFRRTLKVFYDTRKNALGASASDTRLAMEFHLGVFAVSQGKWDQEYADRFNHFLTH